MMLKSINFQIPEDYLLNNIIEKANKFSNDYFLFSLQNFTLFERSWLLWGYENVLTSFYLRKRNQLFVRWYYGFFQVRSSEKDSKT